MLCLILNVGGLLIMMGHHDRSEGLFYYFRLEDQVPETHLLRLIEKHISFAFVRQQLKDRYSEIGWPSVRRPIGRWPSGWSRHNWILHPGVFLDAFLIGSGEIIEQQNHYDPRAATG